jgi:hypothetical protein
MPGVFDSIHEAMTEIVREVPPNPLGVESDRDTYESVDFEDDDGGRIMPSWSAPFASPYLYRGQWKRIQPCVPSVYRYDGRRALAKHPQLLEPSARDLFLLRQCWLAEFKEVLETHPAVAHAKTIGLHLGRDALAQHYGIPTDHLDLTADPDVAAFFATNTYDDKTGEWQPVPDGGTGIIYRFDLTVFPRVLGEACDLGDYFRVLEMIGLQTLPRPGEQKAWSLHLPLGVDFERLPMDVFEFRHTRHGSDHFHNLFIRGTALFPPDVLADKAAEITKSGRVPRGMVAAALRLHDCREDRLEEAIECYAGRFASLGRFATEVCDIGSRHFSPEVLARATADVEARAPAFLRKVGIRPIKLVSPAALTAELQRSKRPQVRAMCARQLGELGPSAREAVPALLKALQDPDPDVRASATEALRSIEHPGAVLAQRREPPL